MGTKTDSREIQNGKNSTHAIGTYTYLLIVKTRNYSNNTYAKLYGFNFTHCVGIACVSCPILKTKNSNICIFLNLEFCAKIWQKRVWFTFPHSFSFSPLLSFSFSSKSIYVPGFLSDGMGWRMTEWKEWVNDWEAAANCYCYCCVYSHWIFISALCSSLSLQS